MAEIKTEVFAIEQAVLSPTFGLAENKTEIFAIESVINGIGTAIIRNQQPNLRIGREEIKTEVFAIEQAVSSPTFGLAEIRQKYSQ